MNVKIQTSEKANGNKGSSSSLVSYLMKENQEGLTNDLFFDYNHNSIDPESVIKAIDNNKKKLGKDDAKFYSIILSPSKKELKSIDQLSNIVEKSEALKQYTSAFMDEYALNFNREGLRSGEDLVYFAKIEHERKHTGKDPEVKWGNKKSGEFKDGDNTHIHIIVSRKDKTQKLKLSPLTNHRTTKKGVVKGGFERTELFRSAEKVFDIMFEHQRLKTETFDYYNSQSKGEKLIPEQLAFAREMEFITANLYMANFQLMEKNRDRSIKEILKLKTQSKLMEENRNPKEIKKATEEKKRPKPNNRLKF